MRHGWIVVVGLCGCNGKGVGHGDRTPDVPPGVTLDDYQVEPGTTATLTGNPIDGNLVVGDGASLFADGLTIEGNLEAVGAGIVEVVGTTVRGSVILEQSAGASVIDSDIDGDLKLTGMEGPVYAGGNTVGGSLQAFGNGGGLTVDTNEITGNLQCKDNDPVAQGGGNVVGGNKEDECEDL